MAKQIVDKEKPPYLVNLTQKNTVDKMEGISNKGDADNADSTNPKTSSIKTKKQSDFELEIIPQRKKLSDKPKGDLDMFEDLYESWRTKEETLEYQNKTLSQRIEAYEDMEKTSSVRIADLNKTVELLQASISALHNELNMAENLGKENNDLKSKLNNHQQEIKSLKAALEEKVGEYSTKLMDKEKEHKTILQNLEIEHRKQIDELQSKQDSSFMEKEKEIAELKIKIEEVEKEKQSELIHMSVDYDNKLAKIQRQRAAASLNQQQPSSNQEIFRKKLQHVKSEYEREINLLKEQIASLKTKIPAVESPRLSRSLFTMGPLAKKMRKQWIRFVN